MGDPGYPVDPGVIEDLLTTERLSMFLAPGPMRPEFWEVFTLVKRERVRIVDEVSRLTALRAAGQRAAVSGEIVEKLIDVRRELYGLACDVRPILSRQRGMRDGMRMELVLVFVMSSPRARELAARWVAEPAGRDEDAAARIPLLGRMADAYCRALLEARRSTSVPLPEPAVPAG